MRLPGTERWSEEDVEAAFAFADSARVATLLVGIAVQENELPGGPIVNSPFQPTDLIYEIGDAAAIAFATGRTREGLEFAASLATIGGPPPALTDMQWVFAATLGAISNTVNVQLFEDEVTIELGERRGFVTILLADYPLAERQRLAELIVPAAFASRGFLDEVHGLQVDGFQLRARASSLDTFARLSPVVRLARNWKRDRQMNQVLLSGALLDYEGYIDALQADEKAWDQMEFRGALIDWPLLAMLVGLHRQNETSPETDLVVGPATRFLHDLARELAAPGAIVADE